MIVDWHLTTMPRADFKRSPGALYDGHAYEPAIKGGRPASQPLNLFERGGHVPGLLDLLG